MTSSRNLSKHWPYYPYIHRGRWNITTHLRILCIMDIHIVAFDIPILWPASNEKFFFASFAFWCTFLLILPWSLEHTAQNTEIPPNFLVWKFCKFPKLCISSEFPYQKIRWNSLFYAVAWSHHLQNYANLPRQEQYCILYWNKWSWGSSFVAFALFCDIKSPPN